MNKLKRCIICLKPFECFEVHKGGRGVINSGKKRPSNSVTCSKKCARDYYRIYAYTCARVLQNINRRKEE